MMQFLVFRSWAQGLATLYPPTILGFGGQDGLIGPGESHGTSVTSIIASVGNNDRFLAGMNWRTRILPIEATTATGDISLLDLQAALVYAELRGANVVNLSLTSSGFAVGTLPITAVAEWQAFFETYGLGNMLFIVAAGNDGQNCDQPSFLCLPAEVGLPNVIAVAGTDADDFKAPLSNFGAETITIAAPGHEIPVLVGLGSEGLASGTSFAAPHVTGAAALVLARHPELTVRNASNAQALRCALEKGADTDPNLSSLVAEQRRLNAYQAIRSLPCP